MVNILKILKKMSLQLSLHASGKQSPYSIKDFLLPTWPDILRML